MLATASRHSPEEIALRAIPALGPLSVDPVAEVRRRLFSFEIALSCVILSQDPLVSWGGGQVRSMSLAGLQTFTKILLENSRMLDEASTTASDGDASGSQSNAQVLPVLHEGERPLNQAYC